MIGHVGSPFGCSVPEIIGSPIDKNSPRARNFAHATKFEEKYESGYDSDGEAGPWCGMVEEEGPQLFDEEALNSYFSSSLLSESMAPSVTEPSTSVVDMPLDNPTPTIINNNNITPTMDDNLIINNNTGLVERIVPSTTTTTATSTTATVPSPTDTTAATTTATTTTNTTTTSSIPLKNSTSTSS